MNRNGVIAIMDDKGREKERYTDRVRRASCKVEEGDHGEGRRNAASSGIPTPSRS